MKILQAAQDKHPDQSNPVGPNRSAHTRPRHSTRPCNY